MLDSLRLLHFHIGSQITSIRSVKDAVREAAHLYSHLRQMGCNKLDTIDVGGGLAVDYDGSQTNFHSSRNYSIQEYANDIVGTLGDICDLTSVPHPAILSESGRAIVAHHSVLVFNVLGAQNHQNALAACPTQANESDHRVIVDLLEAYRSVNQRNVQEVFHDLLALREESSTLFSHGVLDLETRARCEELFLAAAERIQQTIQALDYVPDELQGIDKLIGDTFFCNFSIFQSLPDAWAVGHLFPIIPIHRLAERPTRDAVLADLTCDSDGKIDKFIDLRDVRDTLKLHTLNSEPYYLGAFLVGAYQETLGDLHNLFGDTNAVHVSISSDGSYSLEHLVKGDSVCDVLSYVEYDRGDLLRRTRLLAERSVRRKRMTLEESADFMKQYEAGLDGYTYLEEAED